MTDEQRKQIVSLRQEGKGYKKIAQILCISESTVKSFCKRNNVAKVEINKLSNKHTCLCCGKLVEQNKGRKEKKFCSDKCRMKWWNSHLDQVKRKAIYEYTCPVCKKSFTAYGNSKRKYCSQACYVKDRFGGGRQ